jgi:hypothetical protein
MKGSVLILWCMLMFFKVIAQPPTTTNAPYFPEEPAGFIAKLGKDVSEAKKTELSLVFEEFKKKVLAGRLAETRFKKTLEVFNLMASKKMRPSPHYEVTMVVVNGMLDDEELATRYFDYWQTISMNLLVDMLPGKFEKFSNFQMFMDDQVRYKAIFHDDRQHTWMVNSREVVYEYTKEKEVYAKFNNTDIWATRKGDTTKIYNTSGYYDVFNGVWRGTKGEVKWPFVGYQQIYCKFADYKIEVNKPFYKVEKVDFYNPVYFSQAIKGRLEDKINIKNSSDASSFPRFESSEMGHFLKDVGEGVSFRGGFKQYGNSFFGFGSDKVLSEIYIKDGAGKLKVLARAKNIAISRGEYVLSQNAEISLYLNQKDSFYHPSVSFRYTIPKKTLRMTQGEQGMSKSPFLSSVHNMEIQANHVEWNITSPNITIGIGEANTISRKEVLFESNNLYDIRRKERYHNISESNSLFTLATFWRDIDLLRTLWKSPSTDPNKQNALKKMEAKIRVKFNDFDSLRSEIMQLPADENSLKAIRIAKLLNPKFDVGSITSLLLNMVEDGFIFYNIDKQVVTLRDKLFHYNDAFVKRVDYDLLKVKSNYGSTKSLITSVKPKESQIKKDTTAAANPGMEINPADTTMIDVKSTYVIDTTNERANALFNIQTGKIQVNWVRKVMFSDTQKVYIEPYDNKVNILKDRDINFNANLFSGRVILGAYNSTFRYQPFKVDIDSALFMEMYITTRVIDPKTGFKSPIPLVDQDGYETKQLEPLQSRINNLKGILTIDDPNNKSGIKSKEYPQLPSLTTTSKSFVYYDSKSIRLNAYPKSDFYFQIDPFTLDSLDNYDPVNLRLSGKLVSSDIFPDFKHKLRVMWHDLSLGFEANTPEAGLPIYKKKGKFTKRFALSNSGLIGNGIIEYLGSKFRSDDIVFLPKKMIATSDAFNVEEKRGGKPEFPMVKGDSVKVVWTPYNDSLYVRSSESTPFKMFKEGDHYLDGYLIMTPGGLYGSGTMDWEDATIKSKKILFNANSLESDTAHVIIKSFDKKAVSLNTENVKAKIDFDTQVGQFKANQKTISTDLPHNKFKTSLDSFRWNMRENKILLSASNGKTGEFLSTDVKVGALRFSAASANLDLATNELNIGGVEKIPCADVYIFPENNKINIADGGKIEQLNNARIVADTINQYHIINKASIDIISRINYKASGYYEYNVGTRKQEILFNDITVRNIGNKSTTNAAGQVEEDSKFYVDAKTKFQGDIKLSADSKNLQFDGFAKIETNKIPSSDWFNVHTPIDRKDVQIKYLNAVNPEREKLFVGFFLCRDSTHLYPVIMQPKITPLDRPYFMVDGYMKYNDVQDKFYFLDTIRKLDQLRGSQLEVSDVTGKIMAEGIFAFGSGLKNIKLSTVGEIESSLNASEYNFKLMSSLTMPIPNQLLDVLFADIAATSAENASPIDYTKLGAPFLKKNISLLVNNSAKASQMVAKWQESEKFDWNYNNNEKPTFILSKFDLSWSQKLESFFTKGRLGIASINGKTIDQELEGIAEVRPGPRGDDFIMTFSTASDDQYFFAYRSSLSLMVVASTNANFQKAFNEIKKKDRVIKLPNGEQITIEMGSVGDISAFKSRARERY